MFYNLSLCYLCSTSSDNFTCIVIVIVPPRKDLSHTISSPPERPEEKIGHTNTQPKKGPKNTVRERHDNMQIRERGGKGERLNLLGDKDLDQGLD